ELQDVHKHWRTTYERIEKFISPHYFCDSNLLSRQTSNRAAALSIQHLKSQEFLGSWLDKKTLTTESLWEDIDLGFKFGPVWSIHWFRVQLPKADWLEEAFAASKQSGSINSEVHFQWNSDTEALIFSPTGRIIQGVTSLHDGTRETAELSPDDQNDLQSPFNESQLMLYLQCSVSELFGAGPSCVRPPDPKRQGNLSKCQLIRRDPIISRLIQDLHLLMEIAKELKETDQGHRALYCGNSIVNLCLQCRYDDAIKLADEFFKASRGTTMEPAGTSKDRMLLHAMGHCHIDTAWLWDYAETRRKTARSWSSTLRLMRKHPKMTFVVSQAQQLDWLKTDYPNLFSEIVSLAKQDRFLPVGGCWVEMDTNLPCCESLLRQFHYGQKFFQRHFGRKCPEFWLPDTFGYSGQLPQLMRHAGMSWFLTQKLSWSLVNKFPHHSFVWRGIDGSEVLAHFPPGDSYNMQVLPSELAFSASNHRDKGRTQHAGFLYGHGDGGQGPGPDMLDRLERLSDCPGLPRLSHGTPRTLFTGLESDRANLHSWTGELYLELHNGTYTTHRSIKLGNFRCESALRVVEFLLALGVLDETATVESLDSLDTAWHLLLLNQFHDVLPGSSIGRVYADSARHYNQILSVCSRFRSMDEVSTPAASVSEFALVNPTQWSMSLTLPEDHGRRLVSLPPLSVCRLDQLLLKEATPPEPTAKLLDSKVVVLENEHLKAEIDSFGRVVSLISKSIGAGRECLLAPVQLTYYHDMPLFWDAWDIMDYSWETRATVAEDATGKGRLIESCRIDSSHSCQTVYELTSYPTSSDATDSNLVSRIEHQVALLPERPHCLTFCTRVTPWRAAHTLLRVELPCNVRGVTRASAEIQAGRVDRPTRGNTSWDWAAHEHCSHRYLDLSEANFGLATIKQAIYGGSVRDGSVVNLSLLRSPRGPDAEADFNSEHCLRYALMPHQSLAGLTDSSSCRSLVATACQFGYQSDVELTRLRLTDRTAVPLTTSPLVTFEQPAPGSSQSVVLDWIKPVRSVDKSKWFLVRLYESVGGFVPNCCLRIYLPRTGGRLTAAFESNALEEQLRPLKLQSAADGGVAVELPAPIAAYQVLSVLICWTL
ncbi:hypothetical protein BOX15_Mlig006850g1, partial [Macrostomum lignano]